MSNMITEIKLNNFKCFKECTIPLRALTLLTGINGTGKSTVLQALLLLRQSKQAGALKELGLLLNGEIISLGSAKDVIHEYADENYIGISLKHHGKQTSWRFQINSHEDDLLYVNKPVSEVDINLFNTGVFYLSADRIGPRTIHLKSTLHIHVRDEINPNGSLAVAWYHANKNKITHKNLLHPKEESTKLREQVGAWLKEISPGIVFSVTQDENREELMLSFGYNEGMVKTRLYHPINVGFGLSYNFAVIVALLAAQKDRLIILENPGAHLHPRGQMAIGELTARAAATGAQIIVETHSDHFLNGVRIAVKRENLSHNQVAIHFFSQSMNMNELTMKSHIQSPKIDKHGKLDKWPDGFFDQLDIAFGELL